MPALFPFRDPRYHEIHSIARDRLPVCALIEVGAALSRGKPPPPNLNYVCAGPAGNFRSTWDYIAFASLSVEQKHTPGMAHVALAGSRRPHPLGVLPRGPLAHPPLAASGGFRLGEHNPCYRKLLCAIVVSTGLGAGSGGGGLPSALSSRGADCPLVAVMRAFFFITRPGPFASKAAAFGTLRAKGHESRQFDPLCVRDEPASAPFLFSGYFFHP